MLRDANNDEDDIEKVYNALLLLIVIVEVAMAMPEKSTFFCARLKPMFFRIAGGYTDFFRLSWPTI